MYQTMRQIVLRPGRQGQPGATRRCGQTRSRRRGGRICVMAYDEALAERIRPLLEGRGDLTERKMFGGIAWMLQGNMACGVMGEDICVRMAPEDVEGALAESGTRPFQMMAGRPPAKGMVMVDGGAVSDDGALARWVNAGAEYALSLPPK
jgi:TfoX/Sxy family transcriptional regulator of competence genes